MTEELLREYKATGSEKAFRELVSRYINLVYSVAYRRTGGDAHLAEDVAQSVFADLARKARSLPASVMLGGWLHRHTCFVAGTVLRSNRRRQAREREAMDMLHPTPDQSWTEMAPVLDEAINELSAADRDAVVLRFFEGLDFRTIGVRLGSNEDAAQKRVSRALDKLRVLLEGRGIALAIPVLATSLASNAIMAAPGSLAARVSGHALAEAAAPAGFLAVVFGLMTPAKIALVTTLVLGVTAGLIWRAQSPSSEKSRTAGASTRSGKAPAAAAASEANAPLAAATDPTDTTNGLRLTILAADSGRPVPNVSVRYQAWSETNAVFKDYFGRRDGVCVVPFPPESTTRFVLISRIDDFADTCLEWNPKRGERIPEAYTLRLTRPMPIGGRVVDPDGQPVAGARVGFNHEEDPALKRFPESHEFSWIETLTDEEGRWEIRRIAPEMIRRIYGSARHSNYVSTSLIFVAQNSEVEEQLKKRAHVFQLGPAVAVRGIVLDEARQPIANAQVMVGKTGSSSARKTTTADDGTFEVPGCKPGTNYVTAEAKGYAATTLEIIAASDPAPFEVTLRPGGSPRPRDEQERPACPRRQSVPEHDANATRRQASPACSGANHVQTQDRSGGYGVVGERARYGTSI